MILPRDFYNHDTVFVAQALLGQIFIHETDEGIAIGRIVETEAYLSESDLANHAARGQTMRNAAMFGEPGAAYIYFIYGMYYCFNVVTRDEGVAEAVLIRALEPLDGIDLMVSRRQKNDIRQLCNGPAKLVQAMGITRSQNGSDVTSGPLRIESGIPIPQEDIITTTRVGINLSHDLPLRFYIKDSPYISKK